MSALSEAVHHLRDHRDGSDHSGEEGQIPRELRPQQGAQQHHPRLRQAACDPRRDGFGGVLHRDAASKFAADRDSLLPHRRDGDGAAQGRRRGGLRPFRVGLPAVQGHRRVFGRAEQAAGRKEIICRAFAARR